MENVVQNVDVLDQRAEGCGSQVPIHVLGQHEAVGQDADTLSPTECRIYVPPHVRHLLRRDPSEEKLQLRGHRIPLVGRWELPLAHLFFPSTSFTGLQSQPLQKLLHSSLSYSILLLHVGPLRPIRSMIHVFISAVCAVRSRFSSNSHRANRRKASELDSGDRADDKPVLKEYVTTVTSRRKTLRRFYHIFLALPMQFQPIHVLVVSHKKGLKKPCSMQVGVAAGTVLPESEQDYFQTPYGIGHLPRAQETTSHGTQGFLARPHTILRHHSSAKKSGSSIGRHDWDWESVDQPQRRGLWGNGFQLSLENAFACIYLHLCKTVAMIPWL